MILFATGIQITQAEHLALLHLTESPEGWLRDTIAEKANLRREALIDEWRPRLFADPSATSFPADSDALAQLIISRPDYKSRAQGDAERVPPQVPSRHNIQRYEAQARTGATVTMFPTGIDIPDLDRDCILAYVQDLDDWVLGALLGNINRGKKKLSEAHRAA